MKLKSDIFSVFFSQLQATYLFLATQTAVNPEERFPSGASGFCESLSLGMV